jgi:hypothetical protein
MSGLTSKEHYDLMAQFEKQFKGERLDREDKSHWPRGYVYQDGATNKLFLAFRQGAAYGATTASPSEPPEEDGLLRLLCDLRFALGDNGKRMQPELVEYAKELKRKADIADSSAAPAQPAQEPTEILKQQTATQGHCEACGGLHPQHHVGCAAQVAADVPPPMPESTVFARWATYIDYPTQSRPLTAEDKVVFARSVEVVRDKQWQQHVDKLLERIRVLSAQPAGAIAALQAVEDWWLTQADQSHGAPACIFMVRQVLSNHRRTVAAQPANHPAQASNSSDQEQQR